MFYYNKSFQAYANNEDGKARLDQNYLLGVGNVDFPVVSFDTRNLTSFSKKKKRQVAKHTSERKVDCRFQALKL